MSYRRKVKRHVNKKRLCIRFVPVIMILLIISVVFINRNSKIDVYESKISHIKQMNEKLSSTDADNEEEKVYYVSATGTSTEGTDINNPMSLEEANNKTYYGNEKVLFKSGDIFYGIVNFNVDASEDKMFYIGSYGEGEKPIISGANILINKNAWQLDENGIYKIDLSKKADFEGIGILGDQSYNIGFIADEKGNIYGNRKNSKDELENENDFYCEGTYFYIKSEVNPSDKLGKIKFTSKNDLFRISSNTILSNLNIQYTGAHGIVGKTSNLENIYIHDCIIKNIGGSVLTASTFTRYGNGIEFYEKNLENMLISNNILANIYDTAFTMQGRDGKWTNVSVNNNIFIANSQNSEIWNRLNAKGIENYTFSENIQINTGRGWGYDVRPDKSVAADYLMYNFTSSLSVEMYDNKSFNSQRLYHILYSTFEVFKNSVMSDNNIYYVGSDTKYFNEELNRNELENYNKDQNSTFRLLSDTEINQISNPEILNSNNYEEIKQYYENLEKEFKYTDIKNEIISNYNEFSTTNQEVLSLVNELNTKLSTIKSDLESTTAKDITQAKLEELINNTYSMGTDVVTAFSKNIITKEELIELIKQINNLGQVFDEIYSIFNIENKSDKVTIISNVKMIEDNINNNSDLEISELIKLLEIGKEIQNKENTTYADYKYCTSLKNWTDDILKILIDQYIIDNPVSIKYSTKELTNKDVTATVETNAKIEITNNSNSKEYVFSKNGDFTFEYKIKGREFTIKATVTNIDKTNPRIDGVENGKVYETSVRPIITDENLSDVKLMFNEEEQDTYEINDTLSEEGYYKLTATDKAGNTSEVVFYIMKDAENAYQIEGNKICNIVSNTKTENISQNLPIKEQYVIKRNDRQLEANEVVATGDVIELESGKKYTLIVKGDVNSDGAVNITDLVRTQNFILGRRTATEIEEAAADANFDKEQITIKDLVRIQIMILNPPTT